MIKETNHLSCTLKFVQMFESILSVSFIIINNSIYMQESGEQSTMNPHVLITEIQ